MQAQDVLPLPRHYRPREIFEFHGRDRQAYVEQVDAAAGVLRKGVLWQGVPACLTLHLEARQVTVTLDVDGSVPVEPAALRALVCRLLALEQPVEAFEARFRTHPQLGPLLVRRAGLRVPQAATPFEALTWAITSQQISTMAAIALRRKLIEVTGLRHSGGLWCYPDAGCLSRCDTTMLRCAGFSQNKAHTLLAVSEMAAAGRLPLVSRVHSLPEIREIGEALVAVRGIGQWTVNYALLRGFGWMDASLHGDVAVRRGLQSLWGNPEPVSEQQAQTWLEEFRPWRSLVAAHLWAMQMEP